MTPRMHGLISLKKTSNHIWLFHHLEIIRFCSVYYDVETTIVAITGFSNASMSEIRLENERMKSMTTSRERVLDLIRKRSNRRMFGLPFAPITSMWLNMQELVL